MKGKFVLVLLMTVLCLPAFAGGVKGTPVTTPNYELAERFSAARVSKMLYSTRVSPEWFSDGDRFIYTPMVPSGDTQAQRGYLLSSFSVLQLISPSEIR